MVDNAGSFFVVVYGSGDPSEMLLEDDTIV